MTRRPPYDRPRQNRSLLVNALVCAALALPLLPSPASAGEPAYILGQLRARLYAAPDLAQPMEERTLKTGDKLEVLETVEGFHKVRTADGFEAWVRKEFVTANPPAMLRLPELQAKVAALTEELTMLKAAGTSPAPAAEPAPEAVTALKERISTLEGELARAQLAGNDSADSDDGTRNEDELVRANTDLKARMAQLKLEVAELKRSEAELTATLAENGDTSELLLQRDRALEKANKLEARLADARNGTTGSGLSLPLALGSLVVALVVGAFGGIYLTDYMNRRRHGGFRI